MRSTRGADSGPHQCSVCLRRYKRREHLQRHSSSHTSERPYKCSSCGSAFQRADVLKRHIGTCGGRVIGLSKVTSRRRACDRCVHQKKACDSHQPCRGCSKKAVDCHYSGRLARPNEELKPSEPGILMPFGMSAESEDIATRLNDDESLDPALFNFDSSWEDFLAIPESPLVCRPPSTSADNLDSLHFLDRFTSCTGFVETFDCGTQEQREQVVTKVELEVAYEQHQPELPRETSIGIDIGSTLPQQWLLDPLSLKTHQILLLVKEIVTLKPRNSVVTLEWTPATEEACLKFFSPTNLRRFLELYWAIWHPNVNFVHRPTFNPVSASSTLLAAMAMIGALVSPHLPDNENAKMWSNCVEEMVFINDDFNSNYLSGGLATHRQKIQALQAAYMVCLYQNWEGTDASKSRIRRYRFATLVSTTRDINITTARHICYSSQARFQFEWSEFAAREELIRIFTWIFLLDTAFVIFNNIPPRIALQEMKMHMAVPEACFQATTADECYDQVQIHLPESSYYWKMSFRCAFRNLCKEHLAGDLRAALAALGPLNLFALASAIHPLLFQYRNSFGDFQLLLPIRNALRNWKDAWQLFAEIASPDTSPHVTIDDRGLWPETMWKRVGFCRYCPEYWLLASLMAEQLAGARSRQRQENNSKRGGRDEHELEPVDDEPLDPVLGKYDQTSLRQINSLILGFRQLQV